MSPSPFVFFPGTDSARPPRTHLEIQHEPSPPVTSLDFGRQSVERCLVSLATELVPLLSQIPENASYFSG